MTPTYLIDERPLVIQPTLITVFGWEDALVLQQIFFLQNTPRSGTDLDGDGRKWVWNTYEEWCREFFPFWKPDTLQRRMSSLEKAGLVLSQQPKKAQWDRTKYYRVDDLAVGIAIHKYQAEHPTPEPDQEPPAIPDGDPGSSPDGDPGSLNSDSHSDSHSDSLDISIPETVPPEPAVEVKKKARKSKQVATRIPEDFQITTAMKAWADENIPDLDIDFELLDFIDRCQAKGTVYVDWEAGWRTQMKKAVSWGIGKMKVAPPKPVLKPREPRITWWYVTDVQELTAKDNPEAYADRDLYEEGKASLLEHYRKRDAEGLQFGLDDREEAALLSEIEEYERTETFKRRFNETA